MAWAFLAAVLGTIACATPGPATTHLYTPDPCAARSLASADAEALLGCYAPLFETAGAEHAYNRIGTAAAEAGWLGPRIQVDPESPTLYAEVREDQIAGVPVLQLVYRVHFEKIPLRLSPYFFEAHRNPGLLLMVTVDAQTRRPWFVTTVHTCGCYLGLIPTEEVPEDWLPNDWPRRRQRVYGQTLPALLPSFDARRRRLVASIEPHSHRFRDVSLASAGDSAARGQPLPLPRRPIEALRSLPVERAPDAGPVSFFYESGPLRGHVRGAWNPFEGLTLFGLLSLDPTVGMDKDFGDPQETGTRFYTLLPFWMQEDSRLDRFDTLLRRLGFPLPPPSS